MGIRFECPNGHPLNVKEFLVGKRGICPECDARFIVPATSGGRAETVANGDSEIGVATVSTTTAPQLSEIKLSVSPPLAHRTRRGRSLQKAKAATFLLSGLVFLLLVALVLVLIR